QLTSLETLYLEGNSIGDDGARHLAQLTSLETLYLEGNSIGDDGARHLAQLTSLVTLDLGGNSISDDGARHIAQLASLARLYLERNSVGNKGARHLAQLTKMATLYLGGNSVGDEGARHLAQLTNLATLDLQSNSVGNKGAQHLAQLTNLATLNLGDNSVGPDGAGYLAQLTNLATLDLGGNSLGDEGARHLAHLSNLTSLNLVDNSIGDEGARHIAQLSNLTSLNLVHNSIGDEGARHIAQLTNLASLDLERNSVGDEGAEHLAQLTNLATLYLGDNSVGDEGTGHLAKLIHLTTLDLSGNSITSLPHEFGRLKRLRQFSLHNNPLTPELARVVETHQSLLSYIRGLGDGDPSHSVRFDEAKLLLVGSGDVGKTWLLQALQGKVPKNKGSTKGIEIARERLNLPHPTPTDDEPERMIHFNCWDFGGQEHYQITHQIFFSRKAVYLLVWKPRPHLDADLTERLERIHLSAGPTARVLIVSTHADENVPANIGWDALKQRFGDLLYGEGSYAVSSKDGPDGKGIAELSDAIAQAASELEDMDTPYPSRWIEASRRVREQDKPYLSLSEFADVCESAEVEADDVGLVASVMDDLGQVTYFEQAADETPEDTHNIVILRPEWLAQAVTFVLEDEHTSKKSGRLEHKRLKHIWKKSKETGCPGYPTQLHPLFLWLMWRFDIAYPMAGEGERISLVPEMIQRNQPDNLYWKPSDTPAQRQAVIICSMREDAPAGMVPAMTAAIHPHRAPDAPQQGAEALDSNWRNGFFLCTAKRGQAFAELVDREFRFTVRDEYPACLARSLRGTLAQLIKERWPNLKHNFTVPCMHRGDADNPCENAFRYEYVEEKRNQVIECQACENTMYANALLEGFDPGKAEIERKLREIQLSQLLLLKGQRELRDGQIALMNQSLHLFRDMMDPYNQIVRRAPSLLTILPPEGSGGWNIARRVMYKSMHICCWCEHKDGPHPIHPIGMCEPPNFDIDVPKNWLVRAAPYISWATMLVKAFIPIGTGAVRVGLEDYVSEQLDKSLDLIDAVGDALPNSKIDLGEVEHLPSSHAVRPEINSLEYIQEILMKNVPPSPNRWGGLRCVLTKSGQYAWLCPQHAAMEHPPALRQL
ncbi:MAG: COR domain-containing protein, partial [Phycisphaerales bacterium]